MFRQQTSIFLIKIIISYNYYVSIATMEIKQTVTIYTKYNIHSLSRLTFTLMLVQMKVKVDNVTFDVYTDESESRQCAPNCLFRTITAYLLTYCCIHL